MNATPFNGNYYTTPELRQMVDELGATLQWLYTMESLIYTAHSLTYQFTPNTTGDRTIDKNIHDLAEVTKNGINETYDAWHRVTRIVQDQIVMINKILAVE
jgi:hypothetical protein